MKIQLYLGTILLLVFLAGCTGTSITTAAVADVPAPSDIPTEQQVIQVKDTAKVVPNSVKYYWVRLTEKGADPQTIVGFVGEKIVVDVINDIGEKIHFVAEELNIDVVLAVNEEYTFTFTPKQESAYNIHFATNAVRDKVSGTTGQDVDADQKTEMKLRVVTLEQ